MTHRQLLEYLRTSADQCRTKADSASDSEVAQTLRELADEMETAISILGEAEFEAVGEPSGKAIDA